MLKLYYMPGACSMVPHIALEETGAPYETALVDFAQGDQLKREFLRINPKARVPVLETDRGVLTEIPAILGYIAATFPAARLADIEDHYPFANMRRRRRCGQKCPRDRTSILHSSNGSSPTAGPGCTVSSTPLRTPTCLCLRATCGAAIEVIPDGFRQSWRIAPGYARGPP
jgi:hypothetical protein